MSLGSPLTVWTPPNGSQATSCTTSGNSKLKRKPCPLLASATSPELLGSNGENCFHQKKTSSIRSPKRRCEVIDQDDPCGWHHKKRVVTRLLRVMANGKVDNIQIVRILNYSFRFAFVDVHVHLNKIPWTGSSVFS